MVKKIIGIDLGGTTTKFAIVDLDGNIQQSWSIVTDTLNDGENIVPNIIQSVKKRLELYQMSADHFLGIGVGSPGKIDLIKGTVKNAFNLNWKNTQPVKEMIQNALGIQTVIDNDANVAAMGEKWQGAGEDSSDIVFITLGTGVGSGIIVNDQIIHGYGGSAGEIGHIYVGNLGYQCTCGRSGCLETVSSATGIVRLAQDMSADFAGNSKLKELTDRGDQITAEAVFNLAKLNDLFATMVVEKVCDYLGTALSEIANTLNPHFIIIGGGVSQAGDYLLQHVNRNFQKHVFPAIGETTQIKLAKLGNSAGVLGAAFLVKKQG